MSTPVVDAGLDQTVDEGETVNFSGSFSDVGTLDTHTISWTFGDGSLPVTGTLTPTHEYADNGSYTVTLTVTDDDGGVTSDTLTITVENVAPTLDSIVYSATTIDENGDVTVSGTVNDDGSGDTIDLTIVWGDGSADTVLLGLAPGDNFSEVHTYLDDDPTATLSDPYTIELTAVDDDGDSVNTSQVITVNNVDPVVDAGLDQTVAEGETVNFSGSFSDVGTLDTHTISWTFGDGSLPVTGTLTPTHEYADNGSYTVTLTVTDDDGGVTSDTLTITVENVAPTLDSIVYSATTIDENGDVTVSGTVNDDGSGDTIDLTIVWGDGSADTVLLGLAPGDNFSEVHTYLDDDPTATLSDPYTIELTAVDDDGDSVNTSQVITVNNVDPVVDAGLDQTVDEGEIVNFSGSFSDVGTLDTHTISWTFGDGSLPVTGTLTPTHEYADNGSYTVTLTVTDDDGGVTSDTLTITVENVAPTLDSIVYSATTIDENGDVTVSGTVNDDGSGDTIDLTIVWGDGSADTVLLGLAPGDNFSEVHTYLDDDPTATLSDPYTIELTAVDDDGDSVNTSQVITVNNVDPVVDAGLDQTVDEGETVNFSGSFSDVGTLDTHTISWTFGDGSLPVTGTLTPTHEYADNGSYTVTLTVTDDDGGVTSDTLTITVENVAPTLDSIVYSATTIDENGDVTVSGTVNDDGSGDTIDLTIVWGDGSADTVLLGLAPGDNFSEVHTYLDDDPTATLSDPYTIELTAVDDDGDSVNTSQVITVNNVDPVVDAGLDQTVAEGETVNFSGSFSDVGTLDTHTISWTFGDGSLPVTGTLTPTHEYADNGSYTVTLTVTDDDGGVTSDTLTITVENVAPTLDSIVYSATTIDENGDVTVSGTVNDDGSGDTIDLTIVWGDGSADTVLLGLAPGDNFSEVHTYLDDDPTATLSDPYTIELTAVDDDGDSVNTSQVITVSNVDPAPTMTGVPVGNTIPEYNTISLGVIENDPGTLDTFTYAWNILKDGNPFDTGSDPTFVFTPEEGVYTVTATVTDDDGGSGFITEIITVTHVTFRVNSFTQNPSGFEVEFNRAADMTDVNLYDGMDASVDAADVVVTGPGGLVDGSLVWDSLTNTASWIATGGVLPTGIYNVELISAANAWIDVRSGELLDGDADGTVGDDFTTSFTVTGSSDPVISIPDFARGPQQVVDVPATSAGLPISISDGNGVTSVSFEINYDDTLLEITSIALSAGVPGDWTPTVDLSTPGLAIVSATGTTALAAGPSDLFNITAEVPSGAAFGAAQVLEISSALVNGTANVIADSAYQKVGFFGDATANHAYSALDASLIARVSIGLDTGFDSYQLTDPQIIGDVTNDGTLSASDASDVARKSVGLVQPNIPDLPPGTVPVITPGVDPVVSIPLNLVGSPGDIVHAIASIDNADGLKAIDFIIDYDTSLLDLTNGGVSLTGLTSSGWSLTVNTLDASGRVRLNAFSTTALPAGSGDLLDFAFEIPATAVPGISPIDLLNNQLNSTNDSRLNEGQLVLTDVDGQIEVVPTPATIEGRHIFYNDSHFDGLFSGANNLDDSAIATDKSPLEPGNTATFENYTSFFNGLNGIMIDIENLASIPTLATINDFFNFAVGNDNDPSTWANAPAPTSISVRAGAGDGGSDRITIIWLENSIQNQWLEVTVKSGVSTTGLVSDDIHYWGNVIGETGDSTLDARVDDDDATAVEANFDAGPVSIENDFDINRDKVVDSVDTDLVTENTTGFDADLNQDGKVGLADLLILKKNFGSINVTQPELGDIDGDQVVSSNDLALLLRRYGSTSETTYATILNLITVPSTSSAPVSQAASSAVVHIAQPNEEAIDTVSDKAEKAEGHAQVSKPTIHYVSANGSRVANVAQQLSRRVVRTTRPSANDSALESLNVQRASQGVSDDLAKIIPARSQRRSARNTRDQALQEHLDSSTINSWNDPK